MSDRISAFSLVVMGIACGLVWGGACGGGGGGGAASAQAAADHRIHVSSTGGVVPVPGDALTLIREITFTPNGANDGVDLVVVDGTYDKVGGPVGTLIFELVDSGGAIIAWNAMSLTTAGTDVPYQISIRPVVTGIGTALAYPSSSYTIRLRADTVGISTFSGEVNSTRIRVFTSENVTVDSPSARISG